MWWCRKEVAVWDECNVREGKCCGKTAVVWEGCALRRVCGGMTLGMGLRGMEYIETRSDFWIRQRGK